MNILMCNERFLFRYGVDRVILVLTKYLREQGHKVTLMGVTMDLDIAKSLADNVICIPTDNDYYNINEYVQTWLEQNWDSLFVKGDEPDIVLNCGWPFFTSIPFFAKKTKGVIFHDYGIVPIYSYTGGTLKIQQKVRNLRKKYIRDCCYVITISDYITKTTYEILAEHNIPVKTIHLGVDHMEMSMWSQDKLKDANKTSSTQQLIDKLHSQGKKVILNLGRWEPNCYKNSDVMYSVLRNIKVKNPNSVLLVLGKKENVEIPNDLKDNIIPLGFIDDADLVNAMKYVDLGISPSLWEGFNLPLAEMQYYKKPVLVFNVGAHPEVVVHPWYLCNNVSEMVQKSLVIFDKNDLTEDIKQNAYKRFKEYFKWDNTARKMYEVFEHIIANDKYSIPLDNEYVENSLKTVQMVVDMTNPSRDPANPGIIRVCRRLAAQLQQYIDPVFVIWDDNNKEFVLPTRREYEVMGTYNGPLLIDDNKLSPDDYRITLEQYYKNKMSPASKWLFLCDIVFKERGYYIQEFCKVNNFMLADIFYDDIPYQLTDIYSIETQDRHANYMIRMSKSDIVLSISQYSTNCLLEFYNSIGIQSNNVVTTEIPGEFTTERVRSVNMPSKDTIQFVCVSTLELRKNHRKLIDACLMLEKNHPDLDFKLIMIGNRYPGHFDIAEYAEEVSKNTTKIKWIGVVDDATMKQVVSESYFTVYASKMEGYGMPIVESIWQGKPCLCYYEGAMGELAAGGGCYTTHVNSVESLYNALRKLCTDKKLIEKLSNEAVSRTIKTWDMYAKDVLRDMFIKQNKINNISLPDRLHEEKYSMFSSCTSKEVADINSILSSKSVFCSVLCNINQPEIINFICEKSSLVFTINCCEQKGVYENIVKLQGNFLELMQTLAKESIQQDCPIQFVLTDMQFISEDELRCMLKINELNNYLIGCLHAKDNFSLFNDSHFKTLLKRDDNIFALFNN